MDVVSPGANGHVSSANATTTIDPTLVVDYLGDLLELALGASTAALEHTGSLLSPAKKQDTVQRCTRFALESQVVLYVQKDLISGDRSNGSNDSSGMIQTTWFV